MPRNTDSLPANETDLKTVKNLNSDINQEHGKEDFFNFLFSVYLGANTGTLEAFKYLYIVHGIAKKEKTPLCC